MLERRTGGMWRVGVHNHCSGDRRRVGRRLDLAGSSLTEGKDEAGGVGEPMALGRRIGAGVRSGLLAAGHTVQDSGIEGVRPVGSNFAEVSK